MRRLLTGAAAAGVLLFGVATPAAAEFTENRIGCQGHATVRDGSKTYEVDARDKEVKAPREGTAAYAGSITTTTHDHSGVVRLKLGPFNITLGLWGPSENANNENSSAGTKEIPDAVKFVPPGKYEVSGYHQGKEGRCAGKVTIELEGSPLSTPAGAAAAVGTLVTGAGLVLSGMTRKGSA